MLSFTLDTNCIIAVDEDRQEAKAICKLADAHANGRADVAVIAIMASEKQRSGAALESFEIFTQRLNSLSLGHLGLCLPLAYFDITYWDHCLLAGPEMTNLDEQIHRILFPKIPPSFQIFCAERGLTMQMDIKDKQKAIWRNAKCDVQAIWSHINAKRDVFVSSDMNFHQPSTKALLIELGAGQIVTPDVAATLI